VTEVQMNQVLEAISRGVRDGAFRAVLFGGFALPLYGVERVTLDIDFLLCDDDLPALGDAISPHGFELVLHTPKYAKFRSPGPGILDIDTVFVDFPAMERIWNTGVDYEFGGAILRCASLDILLGTKLHALRYNESNRGRRDFDDILQLLAANDIEPEHSRFRQLCGRYGSEELYARLCHEFRKSKGRD